MVKFWIELFQKLDTEVVSNMHFVVGHEKNKYK